MVARRFPSMPTGKDERFHGEQQRLESQYDRMHHPDRIYGVQEQPFRGAQSLIGQNVVIVGVGVGDATAAGRYVVKPSGE